MNVFNYTFTSLKGATLALHHYRGQPMLIVNTASRCGYTQQYAKLQKLWKDYHEAGLVVIGIPCNDFGEQEPGDEETIARFCESNFMVTFPMTEKQNIVGADAHPLFDAIREEAGDDALPKWNFFKYFFDRTGQLVNYWPSAIEPDDPLITHNIERNLQAWIL